MNKLFPFERSTRLLAIVLCAALYASVLSLVFHTLEKRVERSSATVRAVTLNFAQVELVAEEELPPEKAEPEIVPEPEEADVALEVIEEEPEQISEPKPEPVEAKAQITQEAAAPEPVVDTDALLSWLQQQVEQEKYYPVLAQRSGYEGTFFLFVEISADGVIVSARVKDGRGHVVLRRAVEKIAARLTGRIFGESIGQPLAVNIPVDFNLN